jgi:hypothetical protein
MTSAKPSVKDPADQLYNPVGTRHLCSYDSTTLFVLLWRQQRHLFQMGAEGGDRPSLRLRCLSCESRSPDREANSNSLTWTERRVM